MRAFNMRAFNIRGLKAIVGEMRVPDNSLRLLGGASATRLFSGRVCSMLAQGLRCGCDYQHVQAHAFPFSLGHQSGVQTLGHPYPELPARRSRRAGLRYGITVFAATKHVGAQGIPAIYDGLFGRIAVRMTTRKVRVFDQEPTAIFI